MSYELTRSHFKCVQFYLSAMYKRYQVHQLNVCEELVKYSVL